MAALPNLPKPSFIELESKEPAATQAKEPSFIELENKERAGAATHAKEMSRPLYV